MAPPLAGYTIHQLALGFRASSATFEAEGEDTN